MCILPGCPSSDGEDLEKDIDGFRSGRDALLRGSGRGRNSGGRNSRTCGGSLVGGRAGECQGELEFWFRLLHAPWKSLLRILEEGLVWEGKSS